MELPNENNAHTITGNKKAGCTNLFIIITLISLEQDSADNEIRFSCLLSICKTIVQ